MKKLLSILALGLFTIFQLAGCSLKENASTDSSNIQSTSSINSSTTESYSNSIVSSQIEETTLHKDDIYGKQFKGQTTNPQTEISFTFGDKHFDFMDGDILSYYRNITEPNYENERTRAMQYDNMTIQIEGNSYIVKTHSSNSETEFVFKKIDNKTIAWISEGNEIILSEVSNQ